MLYSWKLRNSLHLNRRYILLLLPLLIFTLPDLSKAEDYCITNVDNRNEVIALLNSLNLNEEISDENFNMGECVEILEAEVKDENLRNALLLKRLEEVREECSINPVEEAKRSFSEKAIRYLVNFFNYIPEGSCLKADQYVDETEEEYELRKACNYSIDTAPDKVERWERNKADAAMGRSLITGTKDYDEARVKACYSLREALTDGNPSSLEQRIKQNEQHAARIELFKHALEELEDGGYGHYDDEQKNLYNICKANGNIERLIDLGVEEEKIEEEKNCVARVRGQASNVETCSATKISDEYCDDLKETEGNITAKEFYNRNLDAFDERIEAEKKEIKEKRWFKDRAKNNLANDNIILTKEFFKYYLESKHGNDQGEEWRVETKRGGRFGTIKVDRTKEILCDGKPPKISDFLSDDGEDRLKHVLAARKAYLEYLAKKAGILDDVAADAADDDESIPSTGLEAVPETTPELAPPSPQEREETRDPGSETGGRDRFDLYFSDGVLQIDAYGNNEYCAEIADFYRPKFEFSRFVLSCYGSGGAPTFPFNQYGYGLQEQNQLRRSKTPSSNQRGEENLVWIKDNQDPPPMVKEAARKKLKNIFQSKLRNVSEWRRKVLIEAVLEEAQRKGGWGIARSLAKMQAESGFNARAEGSDGSTGLMQIYVTENTEDYLKELAKKYGVEYKGERGAPFTYKEMLLEDPVFNYELAVAFNKDALSRELDTVTAREADYNVGCWKIKETCRALRGAQSESEAIDILTPRYYDSGELNISRGWWGSQAALVYVHQMNHFDCKTGQLIFNR